MSLENEEIVEEIEDSKLQFQYVADAVRTATQEAISKKTIHDYGRLDSIQLWYPFIYCIVFENKV